MPARSRLPRATAALPCLLAALVSPRAFAQEPRATAAAIEAPAVALPPRLTADIERERAALVASLLGGLRAAGLQVEPADDGLALDEAAQDCKETNCLSAIAARARARFLVFSRIESRPHDYAVLVRALDSLTGRELGRSQAVCASEDPCPPMAQTVLQVAKDAGQRTRAAIATVPPEPEPTPVSTPAPDTVTFAPPRVIAVDDDHTQPPRQIPLWLPVSSLVIGGALVGVSAYLFAIDGEEINCFTGNDKCADLRETTPGAIVAAAGAGVALTTSAVLWWLRHSRARAAASSDVALTVTPWLGARAGVSVSTLF